jgi:outer membrane protein, multidrug efflux system
MNKKDCFWLLAASALVAAGASSCAMGPDYHRPPMDVPRAYESATSQPSAESRLGTDWWRLFGDPRLDELEEAALQANQDLKASIARVTEARAAADVVKSQFFPTLTFNPSAIRSRLPGTGVTNTTYLLPLDLSYELDIWGRVRRSYEAAQAQYHASAADFGVVLQTVLADVAVDYFTLRMFDAEAQILATNVRLYREQVSLLQTQFKAGMVSQTDVVQAQTLLNSTLTQEIEFRRQRTDLEHALATLIGCAPSELSIEVKPLDLTPPVIPPGLPAELLTRRPDVAQAEDNLAAACALIGVAQANFLPVVSLTGSAGFESLDIHHVVDWKNRLWSAGPTVSTPIFEGGRLVAGLQLTKARFEELQATYRGTVLAAFRDVEITLTDIHLGAEEAEAQARAVASASEYLRLSLVQYQRGLVNYLLVVDAERTLLTNELSAAQILNQRMLATVLLIKALGGGWDPHSATTQPSLGASPMGEGGATSMIAPAGPPTSGPTSAPARSPASGVAGASSPR